MSDTLHCDWHFDERWEGKERGSKEFVGLKRSVSKIFEIPLNVLYWINST